MGICYDMISITGIWPLVSFQSRDVSELPVEQVFEALKNNDTDLRGKHDIDS
jgi:hypothetical protein